MSSKFSNIEVNFNLTKAEWLLVAKSLAPKVFSPASATWLEDATEDTINDCVISAFINEMVIVLLKEQIELSK